MTFNKRILSNHIAREAQLLAEERWIIEALNKIKAQRNSLQIERLNLESIKSQLKNDKRPTESQCSESSQGPVSAVDMMQAGTTLSSAWDKDDNAEEHCNEVELNLTVTNPVLSTQVLDSMSAEEEEEDDEDDEDEVMLDINMLMNAVHKPD